MVKLIYSLAMLALISGGIVLALAVLGWFRSNASSDKALAYPGAIRQFTARPAGTHEKDAPLVEQSRILASYLNPAPPEPAGLVQGDEAARGGRTVGSTAPALRPPAPTVQFRLCGTSYYPNEPGRSMALISEVGSLEGNERWVKEGTQVGHFVVHEIRKGMIVYRDGEQLREMAVEHGASVPSLVRDARAGSRQVSIAADDLIATVSSPAGPNDAGPVGGN